MACKELSASPVQLSSGMLHDPGSAHANGANGTDTKHAPSASLFADRLTGLDAVTGLALSAFSALP
jgi:hypothetical protein